MAGYSPIWGGGGYSTPGISGVVDFGVPTYGGLGGMFGGNNAAGGNGLLGGNGGGLLGSGGLGGLLGGLGSLLSNGMSAYTAWKGLGLAEDQLQLARDQFGFQKGLANRNLANTAKAINNKYDSNAALGAGFVGGYGANGFADTAQSTVKQYETDAKAKHLDESPIS